MNNSKRTLQKKILSFAEDVAQFLQDTPPAVILTVIIFSGSLIIFLSLLTFGYFSDTILENEKIIFDASVSHAIMSIRSPFLTSIMIAITNIGTYGVTIASFGILIFLIVKRHRKEAILFFIIVAMGALVNVLLKLLLHRVRPDISPLVVETDYSFPSGHSMASFIFFSTLAYFSYHFTKSRKISIIVSIVSVIFILLIGISRVYLGVHYPSDVLGGYLAGLLWFLTIIVLDRAIILYRLFREYGKTAYKNID